jgi:hypothetical protein
MWDGAAWVFHGRITPNDRNANKQFARVVDIDGDVAIVSAVGDNQTGNFAGAAYVFRYNGTTWAQEQKLLEDPPSPTTNFGLSVAIDDGTVLVSMPEGVHVHRHNGTAWQAMQLVRSPVWPTPESFGTTLRIDGDTFAAAIVPTGNPGLVRLFAFDGAQWAHQQTVSGPPPISGGDGQFGRGYDVRGDQLIVGAPFRIAPTYPNDITSFSAGLAFMFQRAAGMWSLAWSVRSHPRLNLDTFFFDNQNDLLGMSAAFAGDQYLIGATTPNSASVGEFGYVVAYPSQPPDCDGNGVPDGCEIDCTADNVADVCEILKDPSIDCDINGQIDVCQQPASYIADNNFASAVWGSFFQELDMLWMNQFTVAPGGQRITHVGLPWTLFTTPGLPYTVLIYDDPNNDGDPADAALLTSAGPFFTPDPVAGLGVAFTIVQVPTTLVGDIGDSFFVGAAMSLPLDNGGAAESTLTNNPARSWRAGAALGQINLNTPSANPSFVITSNRLLVRAHGLDCNGNGVWDDCDIDSGTSADTNTNGIPDECEDNCPADIDNTGAVDADDLIAVILTWGCVDPPGPCAADVDGSGTVDADDLVAVILAWGPC